MKKEIKNTDPEFRKIFQNIPLHLPSDNFTEKVLQRIANEKIVIYQKERNLVPYLYSVSFIILLSQFIFFRRTILYLYSIVMDYVSTIEFTALTEWLLSFFRLFGNLFISPELIIISSASILILFVYFISYLPAYHLNKSI